MESSSTIPKRNVGQLFANVLILQHHKQPLHLGVEKVGIVTLNYCGASYSKETFYNVVLKFVVVNMRYSSICIPFPISFFQVLVVKYLVYIVVVSVFPRCCGCSNTTNVDPLTGTTCT